MAESVDLIRRFRRFVVTHHLMALLVLTPAAAQEGHGNTRQPDVVSIGGPLIWRTKENSGANALALLLGAYGVPSDYGQLANALRGREDGNTLAAIVDESSRLGCELTVLATTPDHLQHMEMPVIAHLDPPYGDFQLGGRLVLVVEIATTDNGVIMYDATTCIPSRVGWTSFINQWSGAVVTHAQPWHLASNPLIAIVGVLSIACGAFVLLRASLRSSRLASGLIALLALYTSTSAQTATIDRMEVVATIRKARAGIKSLEVTYRYNIAALSNIEAVYIQTTRFVGDSFVSTESTHSDIYTNALEWPERAIIFCTANEHTVTFWPNKHLYGTRPARVADSGLGLPEEDVRHLNFVRASGWWPLGSLYQCGDLDGVPYDFTKIIESPDYAVTPIGSTAIALTREGRDHLVLDMALGGAMIEREMYAGNGRKAMTARGRKFVRISHDAWLPGEIDVVHYDTTGAVDGPIVSGQLAGAQVNALDLDEASFHGAAGICVLDRRSHRVTQVSGGGLEYLERVKRGLSIQFKQFARRQSAHAWMAAGALILGMIACGVAYHKIVTRRAS